MCAGLSCQWADVPGLDFSSGYVVWSSASVVAVIVDVDIVAGGGHLTNVLYRRDNEEGLSRRYLADGLAGLRCILKPHAIDG